GGGVYEGVFNGIDLDPLFVDPPVGVGIDYDGSTADWHLSSGSPCVDAGAPWSRQDETGGLIADIGALTTSGFAGTGNLPPGSIGGVFSGTLSGEVTIAENAVIEEGSSSTILPGTILSGVGGIHAYGTLYAVGTESDSIIFQGKETGWWPGIDLLGSTSSASQIAFCDISHSSSSAVFCDGSSPSIQNCTINNNYSCRGAGIHVDSFSEPEIRNNLIYENVALEGGGIYCGYRNFDPIIINNKICDNKVTGRGGGINLYSLYPSYPVIKNNFFTNNEAGSGGGAYIFLGSYDVDSIVVFDNCVIGNNIANTGGGIFIRIWSAKTYHNTIIYGNEALESGNQVYLYGSTTNPDYTLPSFQFCDIEGGLADFAIPDGEFDPAYYQNNIEVDPQHVAPSAGAGPDFNGLVADWSLQPASPCIDAGNPAPEYNDGCLPPGFNTERNDIGAYGGPENCQMISGPILMVTPAAHFVPVNDTAVTFQVENSGINYMNWTAVVNHAWLNITNGSSGVNSGTVTVAVAANTGDARTGTITISAPNTFDSPQTVEVQQAGFINPAPDWQNPSGMQYVMTIHGKVQIGDDQYIITDGSMFAAFQSDECRGVVTIFDGPNGSRQFQLTVASDQVTEPLLSLKSYDAATGLIHDINQTFDFENNDIVGQIFAPITYYIGNLTQSIAIVQNWNWVSFNTLPEDNSVNTVLSSFPAQDNDVIRTAPDLGGTATFYEGVWYGLDQGVQSGIRYLLSTQLSDPEALSIFGEPVNVADTIYVVPGWNWIGYLARDPMDLASVLVSLNSTNGDLIKTSPDLGGSATYYNGVWYGMNEGLQPGIGYLLNSAAYDTLIYPVTGELPVVSLPFEYPDWQNPTGMQYTMTIHARVQLAEGAFIESEGSLLAAFKDGECRGVTSIFSGPAGQQFQLSIGSIDVTEPGFSLKAYEASTDNIYDIIGTFDFTNDEIIGDIAAPAIYATGVMIDKLVDMGWNMIGLPLDVDDPYYLSIFTAPPAISGTLYEFIGSYAATDTLETGRGYWLRFTEPDTVEIVGAPMDTICTDVSLGWNIVAGPSCNVPLGAVSSDPPGIIIGGSLHAYDGAYIAVDTLKQGQGYWIRVNA
ncbi:MAG: hypothetical protein GY869_19765, partial [Planctomycetes bacterium]|nr:hypothetical protein [Planctomycetota bacterium]